MRRDLPTRILTRIVRGTGGSSGGLLFLRVGALLRAACWADRPVQSRGHSRAKAKESPDFRFYSLYDKIHRMDVLAFAYRIQMDNDGDPGVDGCTFDDIEQEGREAWLDDLAEELKQKDYEHHRKLMKSVSRRISDEAVLELIEMWLEMPVEETDDDGNPRLKTKARDERVGTPQGTREPLWLVTQSTFAKR